MHQELRTPGVFYMVMCKWKGAGGGELENRAAPWREEEWQPLEAEVTSQLPWGLDLQNFLAEVL